MIVFGVACCAAFVLVMYLFSNTHKLAHFRALLTALKAILQDNWWNVRWMAVWLIRDW